jgi:PBP1b-binding outer membrane lipoprotein LpoB
VNKKLIYISAVFIALIFNACVSTSVDCTDKYGDGIDKSQIISNLSLEKIMDQISLELCQVNSNGKRRPISKSMIFTDFVDIKTLKTDRNGMFMSELLRSSFSNNCSTKIVQAEFGKYFTLNQNGFVSLTRDVNKIKNQDYRYSKAVVGTYRFAPNNIYIFVKLIDMNTGKVLKMVRKKVSYNCVGGYIL